MRSASRWTTAASVSGTTGAGSGRPLDATRRLVGCSPTPAGGSPRAARRFTPGGPTAPRRVLRSGNHLIVSIDHIVERQARPSWALDPVNLRLSPRPENTVLLRQITERNRRFYGVG